MGGEFKQVETNRSPCRLVPVREEIFHKVTFVCLALYFFCRSILDKLKGKLGKKKFTLVCISFWAFSFLSFVFKGTTMENMPSPKLNKRPIIGVVAQEFYQPTPERQTYIAASYVKFLEAAGARVAPVLINKTEDEYKALFMSINGLLFPGGKASIKTSDYGRVTRLLFQLAREANDRGDFFPVWGTCLGFQQMARVIGEKGKIVLNEMKVWNVALPLDFTEEAKGSRMFEGFPADVLHALSTEPLTTNLHKWSVKMQTYEKLESLSNFYRVLSTNTYKGQTFISTMEAYKYPFYGVQWHPEKSQFEWSKPYVPHSPSAIRASYYCADFFVNEARKSFHRFNSEEEERKALIYNWTPSRTEQWTNFEQIYFF